MGIEFKEDYLKEITENAERSKSNTHRLDEIESDIKSLKEENKTLYEMSASIKTLTDGVVSIKEDVAEVKTSQSQIRNELSEVKNNPIKSKAAWVDKAVGALFGVIGTAVLMYVLSAVAPSIFG